jgi:glycosyltransferase involved in cell wall biosynthesis
MKIALVSRRPPDTTFGYGRYTHQVAASLSNLTDGVDVLTLGGRLGYQCHHFIRGREHSRTSVGRPLRGSTLDDNYDAVMWNHMDTAVRCLSTRISKPTGYIAHNAEALSLGSVVRIEPNRFLRLLYGVRTRRDSFLEERVLAHVDLAVCISQEDMQEMQSSYPADARWLLLRPLADSALTPLPSPKEREDVTCLLVGSFNWRPKRLNARWLVEDVRSLIDSDLRRRIRWVIAGRGASTLGLSNRHDTHIIDTPPSLGKIYRASDIALVPERQLGGVKLKTLEAAAHGLPIVSTSAGLNGTRLKPGSDALVADDAPAFAQAISCLVRDAQLRRTIARRAQVAVQREFSAAAVAGDARSIIEALESVHHAHGQR